MSQETELTSCPIDGLHTVNLLDESTHQSYLAACKNDQTQLEAIQAEHNLQSEIGWKAQIAISGHAGLAEDEKLPVLHSIGAAVTKISDGNPKHIAGIERNLQNFSKPETTEGLEALRQNFVGPSR